MAHPGARSEAGAHEDEPTVAPASQEIVSGERSAPPASALGGRGESVVGGRYRLGALLGKGGMGAVFAAHDEVRSARVALKRLAGQENELGFRREFHTLASLEHPNVVEVFDYGVDDGVAYYTMELLEGSDLRGLGGAHIDVVCRIVREIASAQAWTEAQVARGA